MIQRARIVLTERRAFSGELMPAGEVVSEMVLRDGVTAEKLRLALQHGSAEIVPLAGEVGPAESGGRQPETRPAARRRRAAEAQQAAR